MNAPITPTAPHNPAEASAPPRNGAAPDISPFIAAAILRAIFGQAGMRGALAAGVLVAAVSGAFAQVTPGPLARVHANLEGTAKCRKCHGAAHEAMDGKCLDCHTEIAWLRSNHRGLHGQPGLGACAKCHPDHAGKEFDLIAWAEGKPERFDHSRSGWPLEGKHASLACRECHQPKFQGSPAAGLGPRGAATRHAWTGLETGCRSCHEDLHGGALGGDCIRCHDSARWKPAARFDHAETSYPLTGRHLPLACAKCHEAPRLKLPAEGPGRPAPLYKPLPHLECSDCHDDPHQGRLGPTCARCHVTEDFHRHAANSFDHERTRYPLRGAHRNVACAKCHDPKRAWGQRPAFSRCGDCHHDPHAAQATLNGLEADCAACHSLEAWRPSTFTVARHAGSTYPLQGAHEKVACASCHPKNPQAQSAAKLGSAGILLRRAHARCGDCHADAHGGQLAPREDRGACEPCHRVEGWKPSLFSTSDHRSSRLPLEGRHAEVACGACHASRRKGLPPLPAGFETGPAKVALKIVEIDCAACHRDAHRGRFKPSKEGAAPTGCADCHDARGFSPSRVDVGVHQRFAFKLEGAHRAVPCRECHKELSPPASPGAAEPASSLILAAPGGRTIEFVEHRSACKDCHSNPHGDQFKHRKAGEDCQSCHGSDAFKPAYRFDHQRDVAFPLDGAHSHVPCNQCHFVRTRAEGGTMVVYRPTPVRCEDCHVKKPAASGKP